MQRKISLGFREDKYGLEILSTAQHCPTPNTSLYVTLRLTPLFQKFEMCYVPYKCLEL